MSSLASMRSIATTWVRITPNSSTHSVPTYYRDCELQILELRRRIKHGVDLVRQRSRFLRSGRDVRERGLEPGRSELDQIESQVPQRQTDAVELARKGHATFHELLERATLTAEKRESPLAFG